MERFGKESGLFKHVGIKEFGDEPSAPFEVTVTLEEQPLTVNTVGYGVSQALPVVVELISRKSNTSFSIQQPEVHLHPKAQAALGDLLFAVASEESKGLFIETHSDCLVDRFRLNFRQRKGPDSQVLFFERVEGRNTVHVLPIAQNGEYPETQPLSFRAFFLNEQRKILGI
jgi:predicted ATPase